MPSEFIPPVRFLSHAFLLTLLIIGVTFYYYIYFGRVSHYLFTFF